MRQAPKGRFGGKGVRLMQFQLTQAKYCIVDSPQIQGIALHHRAAKSATHKKSDWAEHHYA